VRRKQRGDPPTTIDVMVMNTDSEAVKLWRDKFKLNISASWKLDVDKTVTDIELWREILAGWYYIKAGKKIRKAPGIKNLLTEYERLATDHKGTEKHNGPESVSDHHRPWLSKRSNSDVPEVPVNPERIYF